MFLLNKIYVEGSIEDFTVTKSQPQNAAIGKPASTLSEAVADLEIEIGRWIKNGAEVVRAAQDRAFIISSSDRVEVMLDIVEI